MRLPFVSRALYDALATQREADIAFWRSQWEAERQRSEALTRDLLALKRDGFSPNREPVRFAPQDELPAEITDAILARAGSLNNDLALQLTRYATGALHQKRPAEEVAARIWDGEQESDNE